MELIQLCLTTTTIHMRVDDGVKLLTMNDGAADTSPLNSPSLYAEYYDYTSSDQIGLTPVHPRSVMRLGTTEAFMSVDIKTPRTTHKPRQSVIGTRTSQLLKRPGLDCTNDMKECGQH